MASLGLEIQLLGDFRMSYGGRTVPGVNTPRLRALLAYLLVHRRAPQRREHLAGLFWPDSPEAQARTNLRRELHHLRRDCSDTIPSTRSRIVG